MALLWCRPPFPPAGASRRLSSPSISVARSPSTFRLSCFSTSSYPKIGLVFDAGMEEELRIRHLQVADAARASLGLPLMEYIVTDSALKVFPIESINYLVD
ncbi:hypothetical protein BHM03_00032833 [Ensete ventricosum]|nr:hypothetical protein BHM03_00032833 [Ensete ventricosum]